jgi:Flp pilus assembly protein CpaB
MAVTKVSALVANRDIPQGTLLAEPEQFFKWADYVPPNCPQQSFQAFDQLRDRVTARPLSEDQPVKERDLAPLDAAKVKRAVTLTVEPKAKGVAPLARVDVLQSRRDADGTIREAVVAQDLLVLALDDFFPEGAAEAKHQAVLQATPDQAGKLSEAQKQGTLRLVPRAEPK